MANQDPASKGGQASSQAGHGKVSASEVERYIGGMDFPAKKKDLVEHARGKDAPREVLDLIENFPDREYGSAAEVAVAIGEAK